MTSAAYLDLLGRAFSRLTPLHRRVLWWASVDKLSNNEMARRLGLDEEPFTHLLAQVISRWCEAVEAEERRWHRYG